jgi:cell division protein FtsW
MIVWPSNSPRLDPLLTVVLAALLGVGLVAIGSASIAHGASAGHVFGQTFKHAVFLIFGLAGGLFTYLIPNTVWARYSKVCLVLGSAILILVLIPGVGKNVNGSQRWIPLGPVTLQPSEFAKWLLVIYVASYMVKHQEQLRTTWKALRVPVGVLLCYAFLLLQEPDFGATVIVTGTLFGMLFIGGAHLGGILTLISGALGFLALMIAVAPYRLQRLTVYTDPWSDPFGGGFQLVQSLIAFGRGEWFGLGLGNSIQKLFYLPEAHTDFVFSIWAEETGLVGALALIALFVVLISRILWIALRALQQGQAFAGYVVFGIALIIAGQVFINIGVSTGLLPTKGLTLPFISYGGSSLLSSCMMMGIVLRLEHDTRAVPQPRRARA